MSFTLSEIRSAIKSILREEVGSAYFGKSFLEFKNRFEAGEYPFDILADMSEKVSYVGEGSTRIVYRFNDNPDYVLKIVNWAKGRDPTEKNYTGFDKQNMLDSNKWEASLKIQQKYADVFPRTTERADDYTWILSETVDTIPNYQKLFEIMEIDGEGFPANRTVFRMFWEELISNCIKVFQEADNQYRSEIFSKKIAESSSDPTVNFSDFESTVKDPTQKFDREKSKGFIFTKTGYTNKIKEIVSNRQNAKILAAMGSLKIPPREFSPKNLGISRITNKLVILDASLWEKYVTV